MRCDRGFSPTAGPGRYPAPLPTITATNFACVARRRDPMRARPGGRIQLSHAIGRRRQASAIVNRGTNMKEAADYAAAARAILASRRKMEQVFPDLFADPARDMLLDLFVAAEEARELSVTSCCIAAMVPPTTALRWLALLKQQGLVLEEPDLRDRRQKMLRLAPHARQQMRIYIDSLGST